MNVRLANVADPDRNAEIDMLVDSGAIYSVVPGATLRSIGVEPRAHETFQLADGRQVRRDVGHALFEIGGRCAPSTVVFGRRGDACLLGWSRSKSSGCRSTR